MSLFWKSDFPRNVAQNRRINEDDLSAADNGNGLPTGGGSLALGLDLTGTAATAQVLSFRAQAAYLNANATSIVIGPDFATALNSVIIGQGAGPTCTGSQNLFVGYQSGSSATTCTRNQGIGYQTLRDVTTSSRNVACGYASLQQLTTGNENTAYGTAALQGLNTGSRNVAIGMDTATNADTNDSILIGHTAASTVNSGIAIGTGASAETFSAITGQSPIALVFDSSGLVVAPPSAGTIARLRVNLNGTNYVIGLYAEE